MYPGDMNEEWRERIYGGYKFAELIEGLEVRGGLR